MSRFSRFYSATEAEAAAGLLRLCPLQTDAPHFSSDDAEALDGLINGKSPISSRPRNDFNQSLFPLKPNKQSVEDLLLNVSAFSIIHEVEHRNRPIYNDSSCEESPEDWKIRSQSPSSDEPSPRNGGIQTPGLKLETASSSDGSEDDVAHLAKCSNMALHHNRRTVPEHHATYQHNVLQSMDTQFSKWSYNLNEGRTSVPFIMAHAPTDTHESLVKIDREFWVTGEESTGRKTVRYQSAAQEVRERAQTKMAIPLNSYEKIASKSKPLISGGRGRESITVSKRATLIAKSKAVKDNLLAVTTSANQRRSAMHRNKNRRSIMPSPPPTVRKVEPAKRGEGQSKTTLFIVDRKEKDQRHEIDAALQNRNLDWDDDRTLEALMQRLRSTDPDVNQAAEEAVGALKETEK